MATVAEYVRICPTCHAEHAPDVLRCTCGALLAGIDVVRREPERRAEGDRVATDAPTVDAPAAPPPGERATIPRDDAALRCPYPDCAQPNPPGSTRCVYCNRPLAAEPALAPTSLLALPAVLAARFTLVRALPAKGSESELMLISPREGGAARIAKIYRQGIEPRRDVAARIERIDHAHRVAVYERGTADGHAYEIIEWCAAGSLRDMLSHGALAADAISAVVRELGAALASIHAAGLVHRDLKPENVLVRAKDPLDLVLTDFGIASVVEGTQRFTSVARTLPYAAPESLSGVVDAQSDYWALGMIVLEAATGAHPFAGLSDAVILHHLTTRNVDVGGIADRNVRKLARGLLVRDPARRWGEREVARWLANDATLAEPVEAGVAADFATPYRLGDVVCATPQQLGVALATHWREGVADLGNGQLLAWFRDVQKDHNVVRLLLEQRHEKPVHIDVQLLRLILYLAPGVPPTWRGESIALPAILAHASQALEGNADAAQWLHALHQHKVLGAYAAAGNEQMKDVLERWTRAGDAFDAAWREALSLIRSKAPPRGAHEAVNWDAAMFGQHEARPPSLVGMHAKLLALAYDARWAERLRARLVAELATLAMQCPWLGELGDPRTMTPTMLIVAESLLPEAREVAKRQLEANQRKRSEEADDCRRKSDQLAEIKTTLRTTAQRRVPTEAYCVELGAEVQRYYDLLAAVRASGRTDEPWLELRNAAVRMEPVARRIQRLAERLRERLAVSGGWLNARTIVPLVIALFLVPRLGRFVVPVLVLIPLAIVAWQLVPNFVMVGQIRALAEKLE